MRIFSFLYVRALRWSEHRHAPYYLAGVSFAESSVFPVPPDIMLAPMALAKPEKAWRYASVATLSSVVGGLLGYLLGAFFLHLIAPYIEYFGYAQTYEQVQTWFVAWGVWIILLAGFSPIPYKLFTISAGAMYMAFIPFLLASIVGRGMRFFLVVAAMRWGGERLRQLLHRYVDYLGWLMVVGLVLIYVILRY